MRRSIAAVAPGRAAPALAPAIRVRVPQRMMKRIRMGDTSRLGSFQSRRAPSPPRRASSRKADVSGLVPRRAYASTLAELLQLRPHIDDDHARGLGDPDVIGRRPSVFHAAGLEDVLTRL